MSAADRVGLGVNAFDALLIGLGASHEGQQVTWFAEATLEALLGAGRPPTGQWPLRFGVGARRSLSDLLQGELLFELTPSGRPSLTREAPLVEVPPRLAVLAGLLWAATPRRGRAAEPERNPSAGAPAPRPAPKPAPGDGPEATAAKLPVGQLRCSVRSFGGVGLAATLQILSGPGLSAPRPAVHSRDGAFTIELGPGSYEVLIEAPRYLPQRRAITIEQNGVTLLNADLRRAK